MATPNSKRALAGLTAIEVLIVIATIALAAGLLLPYLARSPRRPSHIRCVNNLKEIGLAFRLWSNDNNDRFPWTAPVEKGGTMEFLTNGNILPHFLIATNELNSPRILKCPDDLGRSRVTNWSNFSSSNASYFIGLEASETNVASILSGDRTLSTNRVMKSGLLIVQSAKNISWARGIHEAFGNIAFADGSVLQMSEPWLSNHFATNMTLPARFILP